LSRCNQRYWIQTQVDVEKEREERDREREREKKKKKFVKKENGGEEIKEKV
jgi:hypothetical protein